MAVLYVDIDLAKNVFAVHGVNEAGSPSWCARACLVAGLEARLGCFALSRDRGAIKVSK